MNIIAFDPGKSGGIAKLYNGSVDALPMPMAGKEIDVPSIAQLIKAISPTLAVIESVHAMPGQGVTSMFTFGKGYGMLLGVLMGMEIHTELVTPQAWKKEVLAGTTKDKDAAISYCRRAFPTVSLVATVRSKKPHDGMADALCILEYAKRKYTNLAE